MTKSLFKCYLVLVRWGQLYLYVYLFQEFYAKPQPAREEFAIFGNFISTSSAAGRRLRLSRQDPIRRGAGGSPDAAHAEVADLFAARCGNAGSEIAQAAVRLSRRAVAVDVDFRYDEQLVGISSH